MSRRRLWGAVSKALLKSRIRRSVGFLLSSLCDGILLWSATDFQRVIRSKSVLKVDKYVIVI